MAQGPLIINAMIIPLSSSSAPPRPGPPGGGGPPGLGGELPPGLGGGGGPHPDQTLPGDLPIPSHPIYYPLPPFAPVDPGYGHPIEGRPYPDQGLPGEQPRPDNTLPGDQPRPDQGLPGAQPRPEHPIVLPPDSGGWLPVYIWGPNDPRPGTGLPGDQPEIDNTLPPIELPPPGETDDGAKIEWKAMWTPTTGWVSFAIVVPGKDTPVPTPSSRAKRK